MDNSDLETKRVLAEQAAMLDTIASAHAAVHTARRVLAQANAELGALQMELARWLDPD